MVMKSGALARSPRRSPPPETEELERWEVNEDDGGGSEGSGGATYAAAKGKRGGGGTDAGEGEKIETREKERLVWRWWRMGAEEEGGLKM